MLWKALWGGALSTLCLVLSAHFLVRTWKTLKLIKYWKEVRTIWLADRCCWLSAKVLMSCMLLKFWRRKSSFRMMMLIVSWWRNVYWLWATSRHSWLRCIPLFRQWWVMDCHLRTVDIIVLTVLYIDSRYTKGEGTCLLEQTSNALQSRKWQLIGMSWWYCGTLCGHPLPAIANSWTLCSNHQDRVMWELAKYLELWLLLHTSM